MLVSITVAGVPAGEAARLSARYLIDESGNLTMPLLDDPVKVKGLTCAKLAVRLASIYKEAELYSSPVFTATTFRDNENEEIIRRENARLEAERERRKEEIRKETRVVHVMGSAKKVGEYKLTYKMTTGILMSKCGGDSDFGSSRRFILKRGGKETEYNYEKQPGYLNIPLKSGDFFIIPKGTGLLGKK